MRTSDLHFLTCTLAMIVGLSVDATRSPVGLGDLCATSAPTFVDVIHLHFTVFPATVMLMILGAMVAGLCELSFAKHSGRRVVVYFVRLGVHLCCFASMCMGMFAALWIGHNAAYQSGLTWTNTAMITAMLLGMGGGRLLLRWPAHVFHAFRATMQ